MISAEKTASNVIFGADDRKLINKRNFYSNNITKKGLVFRYERISV